MLFVGLGLVLMALKYLEIGPVALWSWWYVLSPWVMAMAWWAWADSTGYTKRREMEREDARRKARIERSREAMGLLSHKKKKR